MAENNSAAQTSHVSSYFTAKANFSPMTEISMNLSETKISSFQPKRRRLSLTLEESESIDINYSVNYENEVISPYKYNKSSSLGNRKHLDNITNGQCFNRVEEKPRDLCRWRSSSLSNSCSDIPLGNDGEVSLYENASVQNRSPESSPESANKFVSRIKKQPSCRKNLKDQLSLDSGYGSFRDPIRKFGSQPICRGISSFDNEEYMQDLEVDTLVDSELPVNFNNLISGDIINDTPKFNKANCSKTITTPHSRVRSRLFESQSSGTSRTQDVELSSPICRPQKLQMVLKRSKSLFESTSKPNIKRYKFDENEQNPMEILEPLSKSPNPTASKCLFRRSLSTCSPNTIMKAVHRSSTEPDLIGDCSEMHVLPLVPGRHQDLKSISADTLARLIQGEFDNIVSTYKVIDCRYPYEYQGGHIRGACNYYTKEHIERELFDLKKNDELKPSKNVSCPKRNIVIFHCEFSAQRGPKMFRFLRMIDRNYNRDRYPALYFPEMYLLEGGYKRFFEGFSELCEPASYRPMTDPAHKDDLKNIRAQIRGGANQSSSGGRKLYNKRSALKFE